ncbi:MAG: hypothetical protein ACTHJQ_22725 [Rhizobiaceae bacterium]
MKGPRELKRYVAVKRARHHKGNGVLGSWAFDDLNIFKLDRCKKWRKTHRRPRDGYPA